MISLGGQGYSVCLLLDNMYLAPECCSESRVSSGKRKVYR